MVLPCFGWRWCCHVLGEDGAAAFLVGDDSASVTMVLPLFWVVMVVSG